MKTRFPLRLSVGLCTDRAWLPISRLCAALGQPVAILANDLTAEERDRLDTLENEAQELREKALPTFEMMMNEATVDDDGWALIPFGDWPHEMGMQKFHRQQGEALVNAFQSKANRFRRAICGLPIFKGHPDSPVAAIANQYPDKGEKGQIAEMEVRPNGLALKLVLSNEGADLVKKGWKFISPMWIANLISKAGESYRVFAPTVLRSVGLVSKPNIPSLSLANSAPGAGNQKTTMNKEQLLALLGLPATATDAEINAKLSVLGNSATALANEQTAHTTAKGNITALETRATKAETDLKTTQTTLANERSARVDDQLALAIRSGRILEADKATWKARLESNFDAEVKVLANAAPVVKTASEIPAMLKTLQEQMEKSLGNAAKKDAKKGDKGADDSDDADDKDECGLSNDEIESMDNKKRGAKMHELVNAHQAKLASMPNSQRYNQAFANAKKANPRLFGFKPKDMGGS